MSPLTCNGTNCTMASGNFGLAVGSYLNFDTTLGSAGYGIRDNAGTVEFKDSGGLWASIVGGGIGSSSDTEILWNNAGTLDGIPGSAWDGTNLTLPIASGGTYTVTDGTTNFVAVSAAGAITLTPTAGQLLSLVGDTRINDGGSLVAIGDVIGNADFAGLTFETASPSSTNYALLGDAASTYINAPSTSLFFRIGNSTKMTLVSGNLGLGISPTLGMFHLDKGTGKGQVTLDGSTGGCIMFRDVDDGGWTEVFFTDGTITSTTDADGVCDGS